MRKVSLFLLICILITSTSLSEDYSTYTQEELLAKRSELLAELTSVNIAYGAIMKTRTVDEGSEVLGTITSLFPDEEFALYIRDQLEKFTIYQTVTQAELDTITTVSIYSNKDLHDLSGIQFLHNLRSLIVLDCSIVCLPDEIGTLQNISIINLGGDTALTALPETIGNLLNLHLLDLRYTNISSLPDSIGYLINLNTLDISFTCISSLPDSIGNLVNLKTFDMSHTKITELPDSILGLQLERLNMEGTPVK